MRHKSKKMFGFKEEADVRAEILVNRKIQEEKIPKIPLQEKHIRNLRVVLDREAFLKAMPVGGICAEIGVNKGEFSERILSVMKPKKLHLIDAWGDVGRYHDELKIEVSEKFKTQLNEDKVEINIGFSTEILKTFPDKYFDWAYVDTDHSYLTTKAELALLKQKVKDNGIIAGHDYAIGNWLADYRYGVIEAVHEFCVMEGWELIYLTAETDQFRNFAIKRIL